MGKIMKQFFMNAGAIALLVASQAAMGMEQLVAKKIDENTDTCCICLEPLAAKTVCVFHPEEKLADKKHEMHWACAYLYARNAKSTSQLALWELNGKAWKLDGKDSFDSVGEVELECPLCKKMVSMFALPGYFALKSYEKEIPYFDRLCTFDVSFDQMLKDLKRLFWVFSTLNQKEFDEIQKKIFDEGAGDGVLSKRLSAIVAFFTKDITPATEEFYARFILAKGAYKALHDRYLTPIGRAVRKNDTNELRMYLKLASMWITDPYEMKFFLKKFWNIFLPEQQAFLLKRALEMANEEQQKILLKKFKLPEANPKSEN